MPVLKFISFLKTLYQEDFTWKETRETFVQGLLWRAFSDLFASDALLWNQFKFAFNIFTCRILITSCKNIIITVISNEAANELTINAKLYWKVTIFPRQELAPLFQLQQKVGSCLIAGGSYINIVCLHIVVFNKRDILHL